MYDIAIVGGGPAGATLARLLTGSYSVLLVDRRDLTSPPREGPAGKCCGGLVAPDAQYVLGKMGLALPRDVVVGPQIFAVRTIDLQTGLERYYQRFYINVDREMFDRWLVSLVPPDVEVRCPCLCKNVAGDNGAYTLTLVQGGKTYTERARLVIGADGASSVVRKRMFPLQPALKEYVAVQEWFAVEQAQPYFSVFFDPEITDFYAWSIPKEGHLLLGAALSLDAPGSKFVLLKKKLMALGYPLAVKTRREGALLLRPRFPAVTVAQKPGCALIGEAAGWISPSSAEGYSYAFESAISAASALLRGPEHFPERYQKKTGALRRNLVIKRLKSPFMYHPLLRRAVMQAGFQSLTVTGESRR